MNYFEEHSSNGEFDNPSTEEGGVTEKNKEHATDQINEDQDTSDIRDEGSPRGSFEVSDEGCNEEEYELSLEDVQKYTAQLEHNKKVLEKIFTLVEPIYHSHQEDIGASSDAPTEWVVGEWNGYKYKVPMEYHRTVEKMGYDELVQHNKAMKQRIEEKMQRNTKMVGLLEKIAALVF